MTLALTALTAGTVAAQDIYGDRQERLDSVVVSSSRAGKDTPVTYTTVGKEELQVANPSFSLPMALGLQPSVVTWNEGGTGLGNSSMTIRGVKGSQINVTLNGITLNDAESQEVFWVNIPSLTALVSSVQLQRGLGTSASGAGAFGASVNMNTAFVTPDPFGSVSFSGGSYNTLMTTVAAGSGLRPNGLYATVAWSGGMTDGYIRNAFVRSQSAFVALGWIKGRNALRFTYLMGRQRSGITWDGIDLEQYYIDRRYNGAGKYKDDEGNTCYYGNQTDNYAQHHLQLNYTRALSPGLTWATTLNYTRGDGFDEYYKRDRVLTLYGFPAGTSPESDGYSDAIYRKRLDNDNYVLHSNLRYRGKAFDVTGGVNLARHNGDHFGELLWVRTLGDGCDYAAMNAADSWYRSRSGKNDLSAFARGEWRPVPGLTAYGDIQFRHIYHKMTGTDDDRLPLDYDRGWDFFNPRAGVTWRWNAADKVYASAALGHREPGRSDIKDNLKGGETPIRPEKMADFEFGWQHAAEAFSAAVNIYLMEYWDMLLETGRLNDSGYAVKENVPRAWRRGIELSAAWQPLRWLRLDGNATLSQNQIDNYVSYVQIDGSKPVRTVAVPYGDTQMLMSPSLIGMVRAAFLPWKGARMTLDAKYVGKQYLDNSMRESLAIPAYCIADLSFTQAFHPWGRTLELSAYVNNLFNHLYYASGWRWESYSEGEIITGAGVYPQAPVNGTVKLAFRF